MAGEHSAIARLIAAAKAGVVAAISAALDDGADINHRDESGWTALMWAARHHHIDSVKVLVQRGARLFLRDGLNQDAFNAAGHDFSKNESATNAIWDFIWGHPRYEAEQKKIVAEARALGLLLKRAVGGRMTKQQVGLIKSDYELRTTYNGMPCRFYVFPESFELWIENFRAGPVCISLNLEERDNAVYPQDADGWVALEHSFDHFPAYYNPSAESATASIQFLRSEDNCRDLSALALGRFEWLVICPGQLRLRSRTAEIDSIRDRIEALARLFVRTNRPQMPPLLTSEFSIKIARSSSELAPHRFGGATRHPIVCRHCEAPFNRIARLDLGDEAFSGIRNRWRQSVIEVACCFGCSLAGVSSVTSVSYADDLPVVLEQSEFCIEIDPSPFPERAMTIAPFVTRGARKTTRVGGRPTWVQQDETPECPSCHVPMRFLLQFSSTDKMMFGADMGRLYVFVCLDCTVVGTVIQSC